jgi:bifunctional pyridoxal-dependent enzyme with beta-cystathionase and maltose regulon repressor activities
MWQGTYVAWLDCRPLDLPAEAGSASPRPPGILEEQYVGWGRRSDAEGGYAFSQAIRSLSRSRSELCRSAAQ